jgi:hypothetical protein
MSDNTERRQYFKNCEFVILLPDKPTDVNDISRLLAIIRIVFNDGNITRHCRKQYRYTE